MVKLDTSFLEKSIIYLLNNALEHGLAKTVDVLVNLSSKYLEISIQDNGMGFIEHEIDNYKKLFYTSNKGRTIQKGYGLGLYYVDIFMQNVNGNLLLKNRKNTKGAIVTMKIPVIKK